MVCEVFVLVVSNLTAAYLRWSFLRAALWRGYWIVAAVYLVVDAGLTPFQLVMVGTVQAGTVLIAEVPAGILADTRSRRLVLGVAHVATGAGMTMAGLTLSFPLLAVSQGICGLGWALYSGADVAWITDELDQPDRIDRVLAAQARWGLLGEPAGVVCVALLAWETSFATAIVASGVAMVLLGLLVARWPEAGFTPVDAGGRWRAARAVLRRGIVLARRDRVILAVIVATALINGAAQLSGRLRELRLVDLGIPADPDPIVWFALLGLVWAGAGAASLRLVEARIHGVGVAPRAYALACAVGCAGVVLFAHAPSVAAAVAGVLLMSGISEPITRATATIWVNRRTTSDVRATVHSFLSWSEHAGELVLGLALAVMVAATTNAIALMAAAALLAGAGVLAARTSD